MSQHNTQGRQGQGARRRYNKGGRSYGNDRRDSSGYRPKYRKEAPAKLSLWQRFLGLFGIRPSKNNKYAARDKAAAKTNTRVARNRAGSRFRTQTARLQPPALCGQSFL